MCAPGFSKRPGVQGLALDKVERILSPIDSRKKMEILKL